MYGSNHTTHCRIRRSQLGGVMVEGALGMSLLFLLLISAIDLSFLTARGVSLEYAVASAARWSSLDPARLDDPDTGTQLDRNGSVALKIKQEAQKVGIDTISMTIEMCPVGQTCVSGAYNAGGPNDLVRIYASVPYSALFGLYPVNLQSTAVVRNEPF